MTSPARAAVLVAVLLLGATACGAAQSGPVPRPTSSEPIPTIDVTPPAGLSLTAAGTELRFGQSATVGFTQNSQRRTTLRLTVTAARRGSTADLAAYSLDDQARLATPTYVSATIANLGDGEVGRAAVPLSAVASDGSLVTSSGFTTPLRQCPSSGPPAALPTSFGADATTSTCVVFLMPQGTTLAAVAFQPATGDPITWRGTLTTPAATPRATGSPAR